MTITIKREIDETEFWSSIMGSSEFPHEWWLKIKYHGEADWDKPGTVTVTGLDGETDKPVSKTLTIDDLACAYETAVTKPYYHCGTKVDIDNMDDCSSDIVLQIAVFGDVVYG